LRILAAKGVSLSLWAPTGRAAKRMTEAGVSRRKPSGIVDSTTKTTEFDENNVPGASFDYVQN
jgi:hypothetical protein